jgi:ATP-binding cassette, subfamily C, bacterial CydCD
VNRLPGLDRPAGRRLLAAAAIGLAGELGAVGLLATGAWLLLSASLRPPILLLSVAVGAVQLFSLERAFARYGERLASHGLGLGVQAGLRVWLYRRLASLLPAGLPGANQGDLLARLISDTEEAQDLVVRAAAPLLAAVAAWAVAAITAAALLPAAGEVVLAAGVLALAGIAAAVAMVSRRALALPAARGAVTTWIHQLLASGEELVALGADGWALAELDRRERELGARTRAVAAAAGLGRAVATLAGGAGVAGVAWVGAGALTAGRISPVELGVLVFLMLSVAGILRALPDAAARLPVSRASVQRLADLGLRTGPERPLDVRSRPGTPPPSRLHGPPPGRPSAPVLLRGAAIGYPGAGPWPAVGDVDLDLMPGQPVALTGPSGSGKTSVVFALLRFADLTAGRMTIGGADALALPPGQVRALLAWSPEQPRLFPATLRANLRVGAPQASDAQIAGLLRRLRLGPWLDRLEQGLDTVLGPWGHPVSGGELQRLSVARALLAGRPVLLLDEPTRHLDAATASAVLATVLDQAAGRSLLWVTHRPEELALFPVVRRLATVPRPHPWAAAPASARCGPPRSAGR